MNDLLPICYLITFRTYGTWLHGDEKGSMDRFHNRLGQPLLPPDPKLEAKKRGSMKSPEFLLDGPCRDVVEEAIRGVCDNRGWMARVIHVRTNHVHVVVGGASQPEPMMRDFKAWSTRRLREAGLVTRDQTLWSRHGSTRYLWNERAVDEAIDYVMNRQGGPLE